MAAVTAIRSRLASAEARRANEETDQARAVRRAGARELASLHFHASMLADRNHTAQVELTRLLRLQGGAQQVQSKTGNLP